MKNKIKTIFFIFFFINAETVYSEKKNLYFFNKNKEILLKKLDFLLQKKKNITKQSVDFLVLIADVEKQILNLEKGIVTLDKELTELDLAISNSNKKILSLTKDLIKLKKQYANIIYLGGKTIRLFNNFNYIILTSSFPKLIKKIRFIRQYVKLCEQKIKEIDSAYNSISLCKQSLLSAKQQKIKILEKRKKKIIYLKEVKNKYSNSIKNLEYDSKQIQNNIHSYNSDVSTIDKSIKEIIKKKQLEDTQKIKQNIIKVQTQIVEKPENKKENLSKNISFSEQKGQLPWPLKDGIIIGHMGISSHKSFPNVKVENLGITIQTKGGAQVNSIAFGTVTRILFIKSIKNCIIIQSNDYYVVYLNVDIVKVIEGQKVKTGTILGTLDENNNEYSTLNFQIWKGTQRLNPEEWLKVNLKN